MSKVSFGDASRPPYKVLHAWSSLTQYGKLEVCSPYLKFLYRSQQLVKVVLISYSLDHADGFAAMEEISADGSFISNASVINRSLLRR